MHEPSTTSSSGAWPKDDTHPILLKRFPQIEEPIRIKNLSADFQRTIHYFFMISPSLFPLDTSHSGLAHHP